jgi:DNA ligase N terminus
MYAPLMDVENDDDEAAPVASTSTRRDRPARAPTPAPVPARAYGDEEHGHGDVYRCELPQMNFSVLCQLFNMLQVQGRSMKKKRALLQKLFKHYEADYYPLLRLLLPHLDKERQTYGLKESTLAKAYVGLLNISPSSEDGVGSVVGLAWCVAL